MTTLLSPREFRAVFDRARSSVFRLETLQRYLGDEDEQLAAFLTPGISRPADPAKDEWTSAVRAGRRGRCTFQRVHVVTEPLTDYMRFELTWGYAPNVAAGEDVRVVPVAADAPWPADLPVQDFWLFDARALYVMHYDPDGRWLGVEHVPDPAPTRAAVRAQQRAVLRSVRWLDYVRSRPELARYLTPDTLRQVS